MRIINTHNNPTTDRQQSGVTLIELMVAMTVGLILSAGLIKIFTGSQNAYRLQENLATQQENGRFSLNSISRSLHMADHWGGVDSADVDAGSVAAGITGIGNCNGGWIADANAGVHGYDGASSIGGVTGFPSGCISDYVPNSDILVVRYGNTESVPVAEVANTVYLRSGVGATGVFLMGSDPIPATLPIQDGTYNFPYKTELYYLRKCSTKTNAGVCSDTIPTLVRMTLSGATANAPEFTEEALAENIEQLQFEFGRDIRSNKDTNGDGVVNASDTNSGSDGDVDRYDNASATATNGLSNEDWWKKVVNVRVSLLARTDRKDGSFTDAGPYTLLDYSYSIPTADQKYHRKQYTRLIQIRNRNRS